MSSAARWTGGTISPSRWAGSAEPTLVRVHSENLLSDVFRAKGMGSHRSLLASLQRVAQAGHGAIVYMEQTGRMQETLLSADQAGRSRRR